MKIHLLCVDPQIDFCVADMGAKIKARLVAKGWDPTEAAAFVDADPVAGYKGTLVVPGAEADMARAAAFIKRCGSKIDDIFVTMDSHQRFGIERPRFWVRVSDRAHAAPFTLLGIHPDGKRIVAFTADATGLHPTDIEYTTFIQAHLHDVWGAQPLKQKIVKGAWDYLARIQAQGLIHVVWPEHCEVGQIGWGLEPQIAASLRQWEYDGPGRVNFVTKGNNPWTEHYGAVHAQVLDPTDASTAVNTDFVQSMEEADILVFLGEASTHCVPTTLTQTANNFSDPRYVQKMVFLEDCSSPVPGFEFLFDAFMKDMLAKGMKTAKSTEFLT